MLLLHLAAAPSVLAVYATAAACGIALVQLGDAGLHQQGSSNASAHVRSRGQVAVKCTAAHRQQCWSLTCVLGPQQTAAVATAAACCCLIQSSQRCSEACRIRAVLSLLRLSAFEPVDRSWMVPRVSLRRGVLAMAGLRSVRWRAERATKQREKHGGDDVSQLAAAPGAAAWPPRSHSLRSTTL